MRTSSRKLDALEVVCDDRNAVANAGLVLPMTLADRLGLVEVVGANVHLGGAPGHANPAQKVTALAASALARGGSIYDTDVLRSGRTGALLGTWVPAPSTLGTFLRSFSWADARSLDKVAASPRPQEPRPGPLGATTTTSVGDLPVRSEGRAGCHFSLIVPFGVREKSAPPSGPSRLGGGTRDAATIVPSPALPG